MKPTSSFTAFRILYSVILVLFSVTALFAAPPSKTGKVESISARVQGLSLDQRKKLHRMDRLIVKMRDSAPKTTGLSLRALSGVRSLKSLSADQSQGVAKGFHTAHVSRGVGIDAVRAALAKHPNVEYVEFDYYVHTNVLPNDSDFPRLWGLNNTGQPVNSIVGVADADIDAPEAWDTLTDASNVIVGVVDTGVDYNHEDLRDNMWVNTGEIPGNLVDDDGNGYVDDIHGINVSPNPVTGEGDPKDDTGHGTHVAGTMCATGDNGIGVTGIMWRCQIMALKFMQNDAGSTTDAIRAIDYAVKHGAKVLNNSWGGGGYSQALYDIILAADNAGVVFVAAAGNDGKDNEATPHYPSSYNLPNIIAVAAVDSSDALAYYSNWGNASVDVAAPGSNIVSTFPNNAYQQLYGTSMASPHVAGAAGLLMAHRPDLTHRQIIDLLIQNADPLVGLNGKTVTGARLNVANAVNAAGGPGPVDPNPPSDPLPDHGGPYTGVVDQVISFDASASQDPDGLIQSYHWDFGDGGSATGVQVQHVYQTAGSYDVILTIDFGTGTASAQTLATITDPAGGDLPVAVLNGPYTTITSKFQPFDGSGSYDPGGGQLSYQWDFGDGAGGSGVNPYHVYTTPGSYSLRLRVSNGVQQSTWATTPVEVHPNVEISPVADTGGPYETYVGGYVSFSAEDSVDPRNQPLSFTWEVGDGTGALLTGMNPHYIYRQNGTYTLKLVANNGQLDSVPASSTVFVRSNPYVSPKVVFSGPTQTAAGDQNIFNASATSDPRGKGLHFRWDMGDGSQYTGPVHFHVYKQPGRYDASLVVDNGEYRTRQDFQVQVSAGQLTPAPVVQGFTAGNVGIALNFSGQNSTDPNNRPLTAYQWDFGDGQTAQGPNVSHTFTMPGDYAVELTVTNDLGYANSTKWPVSMYAHPLQSPVAVSGGPYSKTSGRYVSFDAGASRDPNSKELTYRWDFGDGYKAYGAKVWHNYTEPKVYTVKLTVDNGELQSSVNTIAAITTDPELSPTAVPTGPRTGYAGFIYTFDGSQSTDPNGKPLMYHWDFADGTQAGGAVVGKRFDQAGTYYIGLTVSNGRAASYSAYIPVTIAPSPFQ